MESTAPSSQLWLDLANECLWRGRERIDLPPKAFALLAHLHTHPGRLVSKDDLLTAVWPGTFVGDAVLKVNVKLIRDLVGDDARRPWLIETVHRRGYRLIADLGGSGPESVREAVPAVREASPVNASAAVVSPDLVGREPALEQLRGAALAAAAGQRQFAFVTGEPGIGKTAVVETFLSGLSAGGGAVRIGRGQCIEGYGATEAYLPVLDVIEDLLRDDAGGAFAPIVRAYAPTWVARLPGLLESERDPGATVESGASRERMLREIATALEICSQSRLLVVVLEDLHWSDPSTVSLLAFLGLRRQPARLLVVATYRPVDVIVGAHPIRDVKQRLVAQGRATEVPLGYLDVRDVGAYLRRRLGGDVAADTVESVHRRTSGNPLFMVSVVDHLVEHRLFEPHGECWEIVAGDPSEVVPGVLREVIESRIERLGAEEIGLLEAASVAGAEFRTAAVAAALGAPADGAEGSFERLARRDGVLRARGTDALADGSLSGRYEFVHALYQNVLYGRVAPVRRAEMHRRIGAWAERNAAGAGELAHHFARSGSDADERRAIAFASKAAGDARRVFAYDEAVSQCAAALRIAEGLRRRDPRLEVELRIDLAEAHQRAGQIGVADGLFRDGARRARELGDAVLLARAAVGIGHGYQRISQPDPELIESLEAALASFGDGDHPAKALALAHLDYALSSVPGMLRRRESLAERALEMARRVGDLETHAWVLQYTRWAFRGPRSEADRRAGLAEVEALLPRATEAEHDLILRYLLVTDLLELGEAERSGEELVRLAQCADEAQMPWSLWLIARLRTAVALLEGRVDAAEELIEATLRHGRETDHPNVLQMYGAQSALLAILRGRLDEVSALLGAAIEEYPTVPGWRAVAAWVAAERGDLDAARAHFEVCAVDDFDSIPQDTTWLLAMGFAAAAAERLGDAARGRRLHDLLQPYGDRATGLSSSILSLGHPERYVGLAAMAAGLPCAHRHLEVALEANRSMGASPWAVAAERDLARLSERSGPVRSGAKTKPQPWP